MMEMITIIMKMTKIMEMIMIIMKLTKMTTTRWSS